MSTPGKPDAPAASRTAIEGGEAIRYRVRHVTAYRYQSSVVLAHHLLHLKPRPHPDQALAACRIEISPQPSVIHAYADCFGNEVTYLSLQEPHLDLTIESRLELERKPSPGLDLAATPSWEELRARLAVAAEAGPRRAAGFAYASPRIPKLAALAEYAAPSFPNGRPVGLAAIDLMERIHRDFVFDPAATTVSTPLDEVLATRRGVCQDFAHLQIGCLRAIGLAARYVSGYLRTAAPAGAPRLQGADASHAWLAVWCGADGWLDLDPTNNQLAGLDYLTLAWGRDYDDVSPVRGILFGGGANQLAVKVDVEPISAPSAEPNPTSLPYATG